MKFDRIAIALAAVAGVGLAGCDGPREQIGEEVDNINEADGLFTEGPAEEMGEFADEQADRLSDELEMRADSTLSAAEARAEALREQADEVIETGEARAEALDEEADRLDN